MDEHNIRVSYAVNVILVEQIDQLLPQTQCEKCGHPGCRPYAEAIALGELHNKCPPGGKKVIAELSNLLQREIVDLDPKHGVENSITTVAFIREAECIGCTKCIQACPVDAIVGAAKLMHTVINQDCTGCDLCVEPCPVDCIEMRPVQVSSDPVKIKRKADLARQHFEARNRRLITRKQVKESKRETVLKLKSSADTSSEKTDSIFLKSDLKIKQKRLKESQFALAQAIKRKTLSETELLQMQNRVKQLEESVSIAEKLWLSNP